ncbi:hypothetical protein BRI6_2671 [plant metagenome]|uniref:Uncharacterized protein n=1 Tax=plant metagenome TaxID=1297885 RepID=A0A484STJ1_9ZZZZ
MFASKVKRRTTVLPVATSAPLQAETGTRHDGCAYCMARLSPQFQGNRSIDRAVPEIGSSRTCCPASRASAGSGLNQEIDGLCRWFWRKMAVII